MQLDIALGIVPISCGTRCGCTRKSRDQAHFMGTQTALLPLQNRSDMENSKLKYTNPARGILDFCKQKFYRPLLYSPWTLHSMYTLCYEVRTLHNRPRTMHSTLRAFCNTPRSLHNTHRKLRNTQDIVQHNQDIA